jgi:hypothetical protein
MKAAAKPFNNYLGFKRGLWQRKSRQFECFPKARICGNVRTLFMSIKL